MSLLEIKDLTIHYETDDATVKAVNAIDLSIEAGETLGLVGETGAGKTTTALGVMRLIPDPPGVIRSGSIVFDGQDLLSLSEHAMQKIRGKHISMIFQDPMTALNPTKPIISQIEDVIRLHEKCSRVAARQKALDILAKVGISAERVNEYPHQFSGGMKQRVVIAIALACNPKLLLADEPTTALDVTIQAQILRMINNLKHEFGTSVMLITHDLGVVAKTCDKVAIMYAGEIMESGTVEHIFRAAAHPYTLGLFNSLPSLNKKERRLKPIVGLMPDPANLPSGCSFHPRCPYADSRCREQEPPKTELDADHFVRCHHCRTLAANSTPLTKTEVPYV